LRIGPLRQRSVPRGTTLGEAAEWSTVALVAIASAALGFAQGGYSQEVVAIATVVVWLAVAAGIVLGLWSRSEVPRVAMIAGLALGGLLVLSAASMAWADDAGRSFDASIRVAGYLGLFVLVVAAAPRTGKRAWILGLAVGLTVVCAAALGSRYAPTLFGNADRDLGAAIPNAAGRLSYPIGYWNGLAALLAIDAVLLAWLGSFARSRSGRAAAIALIPLPVLGFYLASSRGGLAAAAVGGAVLLILARNRRAMLAGGLLGAAGGGALILVARTQHDFVDGIAGSSATHQGQLMLLVTLVCLGLVFAGRYRLDGWLAEARVGRRPLWPWALALVIAVGVVIALASRDSGGVRPPGQPPQGVAAGHLTSGGASGRYQFWEGALDAYASEPVGGVGAGNFELYWNAHPQLALPLVNAHSLYLETLAELGPAGFALLVAFLAIPVVAAIRRRSSAEAAAEDDLALAVVAAGALSAALEWTWQIPAAFAPVIVALGLLAAGGVAGRRSSFALGVATLVVAWVAIWAAAVSFAGEYELSASRSDAARGDLTGAADDARIASKLQPWSPEPPLQLALVEELGGDLDAARAAARDAIDHAGGDWRPWAVAARISAKQGNSAAASLLLAKARSLSPVELPPEFSRSPRGQQ
jgi:O-antigen ligase/polysaccharide polymerase Wzy-like membrane protein